MGDLVDHRMTESTGSKTIPAIDQDILNLQQGLVEGHHLAGDV